MSSKSGTSTPGEKELEIPELTDEEKAVIAAEWKEEHEDILIEWAEKAMCYRWLHHRSHMSYRRKNAYYTIPVIVISTLTGTANFALDRFSPEAQNWAVMIIGALNISAGIVSTISQFLKISEINEGHRVASIAWDKFYRNVKLELSKAPKERRHPSEMLKLSKEEYDRLTETSPMIQDDIINTFKKSFDFKKIKEELSLPEILDDLEKVDRYDRSKDVVKSVTNHLEIRNEDIMDKLKEVMEESPNKTLQNINLNDIGQKIQKKMERDIELTKMNKSKTKEKENDDFVLEMRPQVKTKNRRSFIAAQSRRTLGGLQTKHSFMIGASATRINDMEEENNEGESVSSGNEDIETGNTNSTPNSSGEGSSTRSSFNENVEI